MSNTLPKELQTPFQRWEMRSFGDTRGNGLHAAEDANAVAATTAAALAAAKKSMEQLPLLQQEAREKGYAQGFAEGKAAGLEKGHQEGLAAMQKMTAIAEKLGSEASRADALIAHELLTLALDMAKAMLKTSLTIKPEFVLPIVSEAIRYLPTLKQPAIIFLHPADAALIQQHMPNELEKGGWRVQEDAQLQRGDCRIDTASNQIDATLATRWERLTEALAQQSAWIA